MSKNPNTTAMRAGVISSLFSKVRENISGRISKKQTAIKTPAVKLMIMCSLSLNRSANRHPRIVDKNVAKANSNTCIVRIVSHTNVKPIKFLMCGVQFDKNHFFTDLIVVECMALAVFLSSFTFHINNAPLLRALLSTTYERAFSRMDL